MKMAENSPIAHYEQFHFFKRLVLQTHKNESLFGKGLTKLSCISFTNQTTVFKENPYFWGQFADRITSYVPVFQFGDAKLGGSTLMFRLENKVTPECL